MRVMEIYTCVLGAPLECSSQEPANGLQSKRSGHRKLCEAKRKSAYFRMIRDLRTVTTILPPGFRAAYSPPEQHKRTDIHFLLKSGLQSNTNAALFDIQLPGCDVLLSCHTYRNRGGIPTACIATRRSVGLFGLLSCFKDPYASLLRNQILVVEDRLFRFNFLSYWQGSISATANNINVFQPLLQYFCIRLRRRRHQRATWSAQLGCASIPQSAEQPPGMLPATVNCACAAKHQASDCRA